MHPLLNIAVRAARRGGNVLLRGLEHVADVEVRSKGDRNFVSDLDKLAESEIIDVIHRSYPDHAIHAEESGFQGHHDSVWVIDPLDGTSNYLHGIPHFCVSIAIQERGRTEHAVVYDPLREDLFVASRGSGAMLNNRRIRTSRRDKMSAAMMGCGYAPSDKGLLDAYAAVTRSLDELTTLRRTGSAALDLAYVAAGRFDGYFELDLQPWDMAAGALLVREAGGMVAAPDGSENYLTLGQIVAGNMKLFRPLLRAVHRGLKTAPPVPTEAASSE